MKNKAVKFNNIQVQVVRSAIEDRAAWLFFFYRETKKTFGQKIAEELAKKAIREFGHFKAKKRGKANTPRKWAEQHSKSISKAVFKSKKIKAEKTKAELRFHYCPLVEAWKKLGATKKETALLCDIAMEGDKGRAEVEGFKIEIPKKIGHGDKFCQLILRK